MSQNPFEDPDLSEAFLAAERAESNSPADYPQDNCFAVCGFEIVGKDRDSARVFFARLGKFDQAQCWIECFYQDRQEDSLARALDCLGGEVVCAADTSPLHTEALVLKACIERDFTRARERAKRFKNKREALRPVAYIALASKHAADQKELKSLVDQLKAEASKNSNPIETHGEGIAIEMTMRLVNRGVSTTQKERKARFSRLLKLSAPNMILEKELLLIARNGDPRFGLDRAKELGIQFNKQSDEYLCAFACGCAATGEIADARSLALQIQSNQERAKAFATIYLHKSLRAPLTAAKKSQEATFTLAADFLYSELATIPPWGYSIPICIKTLENLFDVSKLSKAKFEVFKNSF